MDTHDNNPLRFRAAFFSVLVFTAAVIFSYLLSSKMRQELHNRSTLELSIKGEQARIQVQDALDFAMNSLRAMQAFYRTNNSVTLEMFDSFSKPLIDASRGHVQALEWIPRIADESRQQYEDRMQKHFPGFRITERNKEGNLVSSSQQKYYHPVGFVIPYEQNRAAHGFDLSSNSVRRTSLELARDSGAMTTTAKIRLVQETKKSFGFLTFAPVYHKGQNLDNATQRNQALKGFVLGVFRIDSLMQNAAAQAQNSSLLISLHDNIGERKDPLFGSPITNSDHTFDIDVQQRHWQLTIAPNETLASDIDSPKIASALLLTGLFVSFLLAVCTYSLFRISSTARYEKILNEKISGHNSQLEATVQARTVELEKKNKALEWNILELTTKKKILVSLTEDLQAEKVIVEKHVAELARSNQDLDDFAYVASHDLKAPLRAINHLTEWISEDLRSGNLEEIPSNLDTLRKRSLRLETLLNDLLTYSRAGREDEKIATINCNDLIEDAFQLSSASSKFQISTSNELPIFSTIQAPFEQVVRNFISNAIKHHDKDTGHIQVGSKELDEYYEFSITDNGPGIESQHHEKIFKMFQSLQPRDQVEGSGMGLALIKKIVENYGGKVYLESTFGEGTTFYFTWPKDITITDL